MLLSTSQLLRLGLHRWGGDTGLREECHAETPRLSTSQVGQTCPQICDSEHVDWLDTASHSKLSCLGSWLVCLWWMAMAVSAILNQRFSSPFPFLNTKYLDLAGLKHIRAHSNIFVSPCRIQQQPGWYWYCCDFEIVYECPDGWLVLSRCRPGPSAVWFSRLNEHVHG